VGVTYGVAKRSSVVAVKVLTSDGSGTNAGVIAGVNYVTKQYQNNQKPSVANMSLGGGKSTVSLNIFCLCLCSGFLTSFFFFFFLLFVLV
jgi:subtilisin family serine protease